MSRHKLLVTVTFLGVAATALAIEKDGLHVEVVPKVMIDRSAIVNTAMTTTPVDQDMSLKATIKNISMKDTPEGTIDYIVLVQRWGTETAEYSSYKGTEKLPALRIAEQVEVDIGKYHIGGISTAVPLSTRTNSRPGKSL